MAHEAGHPPSEASVVVTSFPAPESLGAASTPPESKGGTLVSLPASLRAAASGVPLMPVTSSPSHACTHTHIDTTTKYLRMGPSVAAAGQRVTTLGCAKGFAVSDCPSAAR